MKLMIEPNSDGTKEASVVPDDYSLSVADEAARCYLLTPPPEYADKRASEILTAWRSGLIPDMMRSAPVVDDKAAFCIMLYLHNSNGVFRQVLRFSEEGKMMVIADQIANAIEKEERWFYCTDAVGARVGFEPKRVALMQAVHMPSYAKSERSFNAMAQLAVSS